MSGLVERHALPVGREYLATFPVTVIEGARQVGKTTLAQQLVADTEATYVTLDDEEQLATAREDPRGFLTQGGDGTLVID